MFSVSDTGVGVDPAIQSQLFEAFKQGDSSITRRFGGTGLGLAICKSLVNLMGGQIGVRSVLGEGSEFWFSIQVETAPEALPWERAIDLAGKRALVVDPNPLSRQAMVRQLQAWHVAAHACGDMAQALAHVQRLQRNGLAADTLLVDCRASHCAADPLVKQLSEQAAQALGEPPHLIRMATQSERVDLIKALPPGESVTILMKPVLASRLLEALHDSSDGGLISAPMGLYDLPDNVRLRSENLLNMAQPLQGARILLVEDNVLNQIVADEFLRRCGMQVTIVDDGLKAVHAVQDAGPQGFDAVLMDMHMPVMDGLEATRRINAAMGDARSLPIIGMTAAVLPEDRVRCTDAGMVDHIAKPVIPEHVITVLLKWVKPKSHVAPVHDAEPAPPPQISEPAPMPAPEPLAPTSWPGIDLDALSERVHGNQQLVRRLLSAFVEQEWDAATRVVDMLAANNKDAAIRKVHDLKGSGANLGLMGFSQACGVLQDVLKQGGPNEPALTDFVQAHVDCMAALEQLLPGIG